MNLKDMMEKVELEEKALQELIAKQKAILQERKRRVIETRQAYTPEEIAELQSRFNAEKAKALQDVSKAEVELSKAKERLQVVLKKELAVLELAGIKVSASPKVLKKYDFTWDTYTLTGKNTKDGFEISVMVLANELWYDEIRNAIYKHYGKRNERSFVNAFMHEVKEEYGTKFPSANAVPIRQAQNITTEISK